MSWGRVGGLTSEGWSFQPAEVLKIGLVLYFGGLMAERKKEGKLESGFLDSVCGGGSGLSLLFVVDSEGLGDGGEFDGDYSGDVVYEWVKIQYFIATLGGSGVWGGCN